MVEAQRRDVQYWGQLVAIAAAYAAWYELARHFSSSHWMPIAGLRMACLALVPRRLWGGLLIGETVSVVQYAALMQHSFGPYYSWVVAIPVIYGCLPVVWFIQKRRGLFRPDGVADMATFVVCSLVCSVITALIIDAAYATAVWHLATQPGPAVLVDVASTYCVYLLGALHGSLTLAPCILALHERAKCVAPEHLVASIWRSAFARDIALGALPFLALCLALASAPSSDGMLMAVRLAMVLPVIALSVRHGWHGGAVGGLVASVALAMTATAVREVPLMQAQVVMALVVSGALLFGVRASARRRAALEGPYAACMDDQAPCGPGRQ